MSGTLSETLKVIQARVVAGQIRVSEHGFRQLREDDIDLSGVISGVASAVVVEDYPNYAKGPCVLCLQRDDKGNPNHVLWGLAANNSTLATIIAAYRPAPDRWMDDLMTRRPR